MGLFKLGLFGAIVATAVALVIQLPDIQRYLAMRSISNEDTVARRAPGGPSGDFSTGINPSAEGPIESKSPEIPPP